MNAHGTINHSTESTQKSVSHTREEDHPSSDVKFQETSFEVRHDYSQETVEATTSMTDSNPNVRAEKVETSNQQYAIAKGSYEETVDEEEASNQNYGESSYEEIVEELEGIHQNYDETNYDWISEISRPRSYWEERRQAWYREMLDTGSHNEDIRELLQRYIYIYYTVLLIFFTFSFVYSHGCQLQHSSNAKKTG